MKRYWNLTDDETGHANLYASLHSLFALIVMGFAGYTGFTGIAHVFELTMTLSLLVAVLGAVVAVTGVVRRT